MSAPDQFEIDFKRAVYPTAEMMEHARREFSEESLAIAWAAGGDRDWWNALPEYQRRAWLLRYLCEQAHAEQVSWMNGRRMWSCGCAIGYGRRLKQRGTQCARCGTEIRLQLKPRPTAMRSPQQVLAAEEESYRHHEQHAQRWALEIEEAFKQGKPLPFKPDPQFRWLLDWAYQLTKIPKECLVQ
jgi:hypothetical protein